MTTETLEHAARLWRYLSSGRAHGPSDAIVVCCSYDLRVCDYACHLVSIGIASRLVISGKFGNWTRHLWSIPEANVFQMRALQYGIDPDAIVVEDQATNFGENISCVRKLLPDLKRVTFVTKPNSILRVRLAVPIQWPGITAFVDAPSLDFPRDVSNVIGVFGVIDEMVGDIERVIEYPGKGFQVSYPMPADVLASWRFLIAQGFDRHRLSH